MLTIDIRIEYSQSPFLNPLYFLVAFYSKLKRLFTLTDYSIPLFETSSSVQTQLQSDGKSFIHLKEYRFLSIELCYLPVYRKQRI